MELSGPFALSELIGKPVYDGPGRRLGRVFEVRAHWEEGAAPLGEIEESEVVVENLDDIEREVCRCGYSFVVLGVASFEPVYAEEGQLVELHPRGDLSRAA